MSSNQHVSPVDVPFIAGETLATHGHIIQKGVRKGDGIRRTEAKGGFNNQKSWAPTKPLSASKMSVNELNEISEHNRNIEEKRRLKQEVKRQKRERANSSTK